MHWSPKMKEWFIFAFFVELGNVRIWCALLWIPLRNGFFFRIFPPFSGFVTKKRFIPTNFSRRQFSWSDPPSVGQHRRKGSGVGDELCNHLHSRRDDPWINAPWDGYWAINEGWESGSKLTVWSPFTPLLFLIFFLKMSQSAISSRPLPVATHSCFQLSTSVRSRPQGQVGNDHNDHSC